MGLELVAELRDKLNSNQPYFFGGVLLFTKLFYCCFNRICFLFLEVGENFIDVIFV